MQEFEDEITALWRAANTVCRKSRCIQRMEQRGMLDMRGLELRQSITMLREAADALQTVADKWAPYEQPASWAGYESELQAAE